MSLGDVAASLGMPCFPCGDDKRPVIATGFKAASSDHARILAMFDRPGASLIGVPTGEITGILVIDVDIRAEKSGMDWLNENQDALPETRTHRTRSGGLHLLFKYPEGLDIRNSASRIAPGVDVRANGGFFISPPSPGYSIADQIELADMPTWLIRACLPREREQHTPQYTAVTRQVGGSAYGLKALADECASIRSASFGRQEDTLNSAGLKIGALIAGGELEEGIAMSDLRMAGNGMSSEAGREPWRPDEIDMKIQRAVRDGGRSPRSAPERVQFTQPMANDCATPRNECATPDLDVGEALRALLSIDAWAERDIPEPDRLLGDVLTTTTRAFFVGRTGLGKTLLGIGMAAGVASGAGFLNWTSSRAARVLYLDGEMPAELIKPRARDAIKRLGEYKIPPGNLLIFGRDIDTEARIVFPALPPFAPLNTDAGRQFLMALVNAIGGISMIVFDNVMSLISGDQKDELPWSETLPLVSSITDMGIGQVWLDHTGHNSDRQYGSSTKAWRFDVVGVMAPLPEAENDPRTTGFTLSFDHPGKARRRTPDNWREFEAQTVRLTDDGWATEPAIKAGKASKERKPKPGAIAQYNALLDALTISPKAGVTTKTRWFNECVRLGLEVAVSSEDKYAAREAKIKGFRARMSDLKVSGWIGINGEDISNLRE